MAFGSSQGVKTGKVSVKSVPTPSPRTQFALGSRPPALRGMAPGTPSIKPGPANTTQYGKVSAGGSFGNTGLGGES